MPAKSEKMDTVREICVDPKPNGLRAVYLVETRSENEEREIARLFSELEPELMIRQLSKGRLVSYVVQAHESNASMLNEIEDVLKNNYAFVVTQRSFDELSCRIIKELARHTGSRLLPIPKCNICGNVDPFPTTTVNLSDNDGGVLATRSYCARCTAEAAAAGNKVNNIEFIKSLLAADEHNFDGIKHARLVRHPSRKRPIRYRVFDI
ncbi:hypothetical protein LLG46_04155 [bacterium]|nr:hypothetical protein [bacterium]